MLAAKVFLPGASFGCAHWVPYSKNPPKRSFSLGDFQYRGQYALTKTAAKAAIPVYGLWGKRRKSRKAQRILKRPRQ